MKLITIAVTYAGVFGDIFLTGECFLVNSEAEAGEASRTLVEKLEAEKCRVLKQVMVWPTDEMVEKLVTAQGKPDAHA